jgi:alpha-galactosidase
LSKRRKNLNGGDVADANVVLIGAGSASFGTDTLHGIFEEREAFRGATLTLVDVDARRLETMTRFARRASEEKEAELRIESSTDRRSALEGADFVIVSVDVERVDAWRKDWQIPIAHGVAHTLGENGGPGGLSHGLRSVPLVLDIARDIEAVAPEALVLNYTNPMSRVCLALTRYTDLRVIGLCHQIGHAYSSVGRVLGWVDVDPYSPEGRAQVREVFDRIELQACGLNHFTFITNMHDRRSGEDLLPSFRAALATMDPGFEPVCRSLHDAFGLYPTGGDSHVGEYVAWAGRTSTGPDFDHLAARGAERAARVAAAVQGRLAVDEVLDPEGKLPLERAPAIIAALMTGRSQRELAVNVVNEGSIGGLPDWAIVEVPAVVSSAGVQAVSMGALPEGITALLNAQVAIQDRTVEAAVHGDRAAARQAMLLDPIANQDAERALMLLDDLLAAHTSLLPRFEAAPSALVA